MENEQRIKEIEFAISQLESDKLLDSAKINYFIDMNKTRSELIREYEKQLQLLTALKTH